MAEESKFGGVLKEEPKAPPSSPPEEEQEVSKFGGVPTGIQAEKTGTSIGAQVRAVGQGIIGSVLGDLPDIVVDLVKFATVDRQKDAARGVIDELISRGLVRSKKTGEVLTEMPPELEEFLTPSEGGNFRAFLADAGLTFRDPSDLPPEERMAGQAGELIGLVLPISGGFLGTAKLLKAANKLPQGPGFFAKIMRFAAENPSKFAAVEAGSLGGAVTGGAVAEAFFPDEPIPRLVGEVGGGFVNPLTLPVRIGQLGLRSGKKAFKALGQLFSKTRREEEAARLIQERALLAGEDPAALAKALRTPGVPGTETLSSAQKIGSPTLLAIERQVVQRDSNLGLRIEEAGQKSLESLRTQADTLARSGNPADLEQAMVLRVEYLDTLIARRLEQGLRESLEATARIPKGLTPKDKADASARAFNALDRALSDMRKIEKSLWTKASRVTAKGGAPNTSTIASFRKVQGERLKEFGLDPATEKFIKRLINPKQKVTVQELVNFRSIMLSKARAAARSGNLQDARHFGLLAEGALKDLAKVKGPAFDTARSFSRLLNDNFTRSFVGEAFGATTRTGAKAVSPEEMLGKAFGGKPEAVAKRFNQLAQAARVTDEQKVVAGIKAKEQPFTPIVQEASEDFLRILAADAIDPNTGRLNPDKLQKFLTQNRALIEERFPELLPDLQSAEALERALIALEASPTTALIRSEQDAIASLLKFENPVPAIDRMLKGAQPAIEYANLSKAAKRAGAAAVAGLKTATLKGAFRTASRNGNPSAQKLSTALFEPVSKGKSSMVEIMQRNGIMSKTEVAALKKIVNEMVRVEEVMKATRTIENVLGEPDVLFDLLVRMVSVTAVSKSPIGPAGPGRLVIAGAASQVGRKLFEKLPRSKIMDVIKLAAENPSFMAFLLSKEVAPSKSVLKELANKPGVALNASAQAALAQFKGTKVKKLNGFLLAAGIITVEDELSQTNVNEGN